MRPKVKPQQVYLERVFNISSVPHTKKYVHSFRSPAYLLPTQFYQTKKVSRHVLFQLRCYYITSECILKIGVVNTFCPLLLLLISLLDCRLRSRIVYIRHEVVEPCRDVPAERAVRHLAECLRPGGRVGTSHTALVALHVSTRLARCSLRDREEREREREKFTTKRFSHNTCP